MSFRNNELGAEGYVTHPNSRDACPSSPRRVEVGLQMAEARAQPVHLERVLDVAGQVGSFAFALSESRRSTLNSNGKSDD